MGTRAVEFLGRTFTRPGAHGAFRTQPGSASASPDLNTMVIIGAADNGWDANDINLPFSQRVMEFGAADESKAVLSSGNLADAINNAFKPSKDSRFASGPTLIRGLNPNPNVAAQGTALSIDPAISHALKAIVPGPKGNQIRFRISNGGTIIQVGDAVNIQQSSPLNASDLSIEYTGDATSAILTFDGATVGVALNGQTDSTQGFSALVKTYETIGALAAYINSLPGYSATVLSQPDVKSIDLDHILVADAVDIKSAKVIGSLLKRQEAFFAGQGLAQIVAATTRKPLADMSVFTYLSGGATGVATTQKWLDALDLVFDTAQAKGFYVNVCTDDEVVRLYLADKVSKANSVSGSDERFAGAGLDTTTSIDSRITDIKTTNSEYVTLGFSPVTTYAADNSTRRTFSGWMIAVFHNAIKASANVREAATNKDLNILDAPEVLTATQITKVLQAGALVVTRKPNSGPFKIEFALTSYQAENLILNQCSTVCTALALVKDFREWLNATYLGEVPTDPEAFGSGLTDADIRTAVTQRFDNVYIRQFGWLTRNIYTGEGAFDRNFQIKRDGDAIYFIFKDGKLVTPMNFMFFLIGLDVVRGTSTGSAS
ncbi:hypothetical protein EHO57_13920 [Leptospira langatensis]|uniref:Phage tail protein n=1 Tax=Leptospira langatensis TaxID=2484983 RepID=A0A5R2AT12_9LEPT|nr:hypothetical protein [Leptospira langatensis]TGJ99853.1 hypothetical protein EHO57_13920 [Leptospira langatensis]